MTKAKTKKSAKIVEEPVTPPTPASNAIAALMDMPDGTDFILLYAKDGRIDRISSEMPVERFCFWVDLHKLLMLKSLLP